MNPKTGENLTHTFNLANCPFKELDDNVIGNVFTITLPVSKKSIKFKLLTGKDEVEIDKELKALQKLNSDVSKELTTRLKHAIVEADGKEDKTSINNFVDNMLARDSMFLRQEITRVSPDIQLQQKIDIEGEQVMVDIPMTSNFFWPSTTS